MLVYVNQLEIVGRDSLTTVINTVGGWFKEQTGHHFTIEDLTSGSDFSFSGKKIRKYKADAKDPILYGFLFSTPDNSVGGRQWITEIGIRVEEGSVLFTLLLETSDISTRVTDIPVTTKPKLIKYIRENCELSPDTVGVRVRSLVSEEDSLRALKFEIERDERQAPIVLLSHQLNGECVVSPQTLQGHLLGLAQVVEVDEHMDSWLMERELGRRYSAWGGAINIIYPARGNSYCRNKLYLSNELDKLTEKEVNVNLEILSRITHFSNGYRKRKHFSPQDVRAKRAADHRKYLQDKFQESRNDESQDELLEEAFQQIEEHDHVLIELQEKHEKELESEQVQALNALEEVDRKDQEIWRLKAKLSAFDGFNEEILDSAVINAAFEAVRNPQPETCLYLLELTFPDRIIVLESASKSARESASFSKTQKLSDLLFRLATEYYDKIISGPDSQARQVFGNSEFAAQESETVANNTELLRKRTFDYRGTSTPMLKHLKIGVNDSVVDTIRVHFHWDSENKKIVIGYCGPHLPL